MHAIVLISILGVSLLGGCRAGFDADPTTGVIDGGGVGDGRSDATVGEPVCGNGWVEPGELCDDENTVDDDGCAACRVTDGWACEGAPSVCVIDCGDGQVLAPESCDDGGLLSGDGCDSQCRVEEGWSCDNSGEPSRCRPSCAGADCATCGDGILGEGETCDDGDTQSGDGCGSECQEEEGWDCRGPAGGCTTICGDGLTVGTEECDDMNQVGDPDGCTGCAADDGWTCTVDDDWKSNCVEDGYCGDNEVNGSEGCDDGNTSADDGCADCEVTDGWWCETPDQGGSQCCYDPDGDQYGNLGSICLGLDCAEGDGAIHPGAEELCDGVDNDCDLGTDEELQQPCYDGPIGTQEVGQCANGTQHCLAGQWSSCIGQRLPSPERCNEEDDDCDGDVDEELGSLFCGLGVCGTTVPVCGDEPCPVVIGGADEICDGYDNDCDGIVDDGCDCVFVSDLAPPDGGEGTVENPFGSIQAAVWKSAEVGKTLVCVAGPAGCGQNVSGTSTYDGAIEMANGVSVQGGYIPGQSDRSSSCDVEITAYETDATVVFDGSVTDPTTLDEVRVTNHMVTQTGGTARTVLVDSAKGAIITDGVIMANNKGGWSVSYGVQVYNGALKLLDTAVYGSNHATLSVGLHATDSTVVVEGCDSKDTTGTCLPTTGEGVQISSQPHYGSQEWAANGRGIVLINSPGSLVDATAVSAAGAVTAVGIEISGDAAGTRITKSAVSSLQADSWAAGLYLHDCEGSNPIVTDNGWISAGGPTTAVSYGIRAFKCGAVIADNARIAGGELALESADSYGIQCEEQSPCSIVGNTLILATDSVLTGESVAVHCDGSCAEVTGNTLDGGSGTTTTGLWLDESAAFVDRNSIHGGCGELESAGIRAVDASSRIQNNFVVAGDCADLEPGGQFVALWAQLGPSSADLDVHSNTFDGAGAATDCTSVGVLLGGFDDASPPKGFYRNNLMREGVCDVRAAMAEEGPAADPAVMTFNHLESEGSSGSGEGAMYLDEGMQDKLSDASEVDEANGGVGTQGGPSEITTSLAFPYTFTDTSPLFDAGAHDGVPTHDFHGHPRPTSGGSEWGSPDIGCVEKQPL